MAINVNRLAQRIAKLEGKKKQTDIAQIMEVTTTALRLLAGYAEDDVLELLERFRGLPTQRLRREKKRSDE